MIPAFHIVSERLPCFGIGAVFGVVFMCLLQINRISGSED